jgi:hypothetical protein
LSAFLETVGLCVLNQNLGEFTVFNVDLKCSCCPSAMHALVANAISRDIDIFNGNSVLFDQFDKLIMPIIGTKICCVYIIFHVFTFVISYFMYFLLCSSAVLVIGLLAVVSTH